MTGIRFCIRLSKDVNGNELKCQYYIINVSETAVYSICIYYVVFEIDGEKFKNSDEILTSSPFGLYEREMVYNQTE